MECKLHKARYDTRYIPKVQLLVGNLRPCCDESKIYDSCIKWHAKLTMSES